MKYAWMQQECRAFGEIECFGVGGMAKCKLSETFLFAEELYAVGYSDEQFWGFMVFKAIDGLIRAVAIPDFNRHTAEEGEKRLA